MIRSRASDAYSEVERKRVYEWFTKTLITRLDNPATGVIMVVMQRLHEDDLSVRFSATPQRGRHLSFGARNGSEPRRIELAAGNYIWEPGEDLLPWHLLRREQDKILSDLGEAAFLRPIHAGAAAGFRRHRED